MRLSISSNVLETKEKREVFESMNKLYSAFWNERLEKGHEHENEVVLSYTQHNIMMIDYLGNKKTEDLFIQTLIARSVFNDWFY